MPIMPMRAQRLLMTLLGMLAPSMPWTLHQAQNNLTNAMQELSMHPCILTAIWLSLSTIRRDIPYPNISQEVLPLLCHPIQQQLRLGWDQLYQGRISTGWAHAIDKIHPELKLTGKQVMTQLTKVIWTFVLETWKTRNNHLHQNADQLNLPNYRQVVIHLYEQQHLLLPATWAALYWQPLESLLEQPAPWLQTWTTWGLSYFNQQLKVAKTQATLHTPNICTFFGQQTQQTHDLQPP